MKRFKALFMSLVLLTCMLGTSSTVNAATYSTGKAVIPVYGAGGSNQTSINISNITDSPIDVTVTLYYPDGTIIIDDGSISTGLIYSTYATMLNYNDQHTDSTLTFTLNAHSTCRFKTNITTSQIQNGYGVISWSQNGTTLQGLVANASLGATTTTYTTAQNITINGGMPF